MRFIDRWCQVNGIAAETVVGWIAAHESDYSARDGNATHHAPRDSMTTGRRLCDIPSTSTVRRSFVRADPARHGTWRCVHDDPHGRTPDGAVG